MDERRRRRLATESEGIDGAREQKRRSGRSTTSKTARLHRMRRATHFPLRKLFSSKLWKVWGLGLLLMMSGMAVIAATWSAAEHPEWMGPGLVRFFDLASNRVVPYFNSVLLASSGQAALLIWWVRSRSLHDFNAQYRVWLWAATADFVMAVSLVTGAHLAWSETIAWLWIIDFPNKKLWFWMGPALVLGGVTFRVVNRDMRECRSSRCLWWLSGLCFAILGAWQFGDLPRWIAERSSLPLALVESSVLTVGCVLLLQSMLLHIRHVIYKSVEPPEGKPSWIGTLLSKLNPFRILSRRWKRALSDEEQPGRRRKRKVAASRKSSKATAKSVVGESNSDTIDDADNEEVDSAEEETHLARASETVRGGGAHSKSANEPRGNDNPVKQPVNPAVSASKVMTSERPASTPSRTDSTISRTDSAESDPHRSLSKKERRRLKQLRRDEQRQTRVI